jgi:alpha-L-glutamate ligase-like protein/uncharacterized protein (TIGR02421 family)
MFPFPSSRGILGLNARSLLYIKPFNPRKAVAFADDKLKTKAFLSARGIPVAKMYARIEDHRQLRTFDFNQLPDECVLKPNYGFGGGGIILLKRKNGEFYEQGKRLITDKELREHIEDILDGKYSVNGLPDSAFFEKILVPDSSFAPFRPAGLPDIRIVVFNLVPVMAMLRVPTAQSGGKANVHLGGIGIGIDIAKGITTYATQFNKRINELPAGGSPSGIEIPGWEQLLLIASKIQYITNIGYLAVDLTIDEEQGPVLLEVNARAGLMVQVANLAPLRSRLERVGGLQVQTPEKGVRLAQDLFGAKATAHRHQAAAPEKPVLGVREMISISGDGTAVEVPSLIVPDSERTLFAPDLIRELKEMGAAEVESADESTYRVKFTLGGKKIQTVVREGEVSPASVRAIIGRRDIVGFLIDPSKTAEFSIVRSTVKEDLRAIDRLLAGSDEELALLKHVKPENLPEEREKARGDQSYNPVFQYALPRTDLDDLENKILALTIDDSPIGMLFKKKRSELLQRISLIRARGNARRFTEASAALFGVPSSVLITSAHSVLRNRAACDLPPPANELLTPEEAKIQFEEVLEKYGLHDWQIIIREHTIARMTVGGKKLTLRADATFSKKYLPALIAHEIETHVLTAENGDHQPYELFRRGFANYLDTQEGLAIVNQNRFLSPYHEKRFGPVRNILAAAYALEHSFADTRHYLQNDLGYDEAKALSKAIELKRGLADTSEPGALTKGIVYYRGQRAIEQFMEGGGDLARLYIGKIALEDLEQLEAIPGLKAPIVLPSFLRPPIEEKKKVRKKK